MEIAAFVVGCLGFATGAVSIGWQIAAWFMDGRRARVRLVHGLLQPGSSITGPIERDGKFRDLSSLRAQGFGGEEVLGIEVTNIGRQRLRVKRYSVALVKGGFEAVPHGDSRGPALPHWLEPGDSETWYAPVAYATQLVDSVRSIGRTARDVRMNVELQSGEKVSTPRRVRL